MKTCADIVVPFWSGLLVWPVEKTSQRIVIYRAWFERFGNRCLFCGVQMKIKFKKKGVGLSKATIDHINARCFGGTNAPNNLQVICLGCNRKKSVAEQVYSIYVECRA